MNKDNKYYVYGYLYPDNKEYMYIGSGSGDRIQHHLRPSIYNLERNRTHPFYSKIRDLVDAGTPPIKVEIKCGLARSEASTLESKLIVNYGRALTGDGPLLNIKESSRYDRLRCPYCKARCNYNSRYVGKFILNHFKNCRYKDEYENLRKKPVKATVGSGVSQLLDTCESMHEYMIRREFYGYHSGEVTGDEIGDFMCDPTEEHHFRGNIFSYRSVYESFISEELLEYSIKGLSSIKV